MFIKVYTCFFCVWNKIMRLGHEIYALHLNKNNFKFDAIVFPYPPEVSFENNGGKY